MNHFLSIARYVALMIMSVLATVSCADKDGSSANETVPEPGAVLSAVQQTGRLYVTQYTMRKIVTADDIKQIEGTILNRKYKIRLPVGDRKVAIPVDAVFKAYVDFSGIGPEDVTVSQNPRSVIITLPEPQIELISTTVDHAGIKEYRDGLRSRFSNEELAEFEKQGRAVMVNAIPKSEMQATARMNAAEQLIPMLVKAGFPRDSITIQFSSATQEHNALPIVFPETTKQDNR